MENGDNAVPREGEIWTDKNPPPEIAGERAAKAAEKAAQEQQETDARNISIVQQEWELEQTKAKNIALMREGISEFVVPSGNTLTSLVVTLDESDKLERNFVGRYKPYRDYTLNANGDPEFAYEIHCEKNKDGLLKPTRYFQALRPGEQFVPPSGFLDHHEGRAPIGAPYIDIQFIEGEIGSVGLTWRNEHTDTSYGVQSDPIDYHIEWLSDRPMLHELLSMSLFSDSGKGRLQTLTCTLDDAQPALVYTAPGEESNKRIGRADYVFDPSTDLLKAGKVGWDWVKQSDPQHTVTQRPEEVAPFKQFTLPASQYRAILGEMLSFIPVQPSVSGT
ncbi:MAG: hypothetical protein ACREHC_04295 [Candidatus Levyibacteriota bacterium]